MKPTSGRGGASRPQQAAVHPVYEDFRPAFERQREEEAEKLLVYLPGLQLISYIFFSGFPKENIRVSTEGKNTVRIRGEHLVASNLWNRFQEDFAAPEDEPYEKRQLLMSAGAAVLITVAALGAAYISLHYRETN